MSEYIDSAVRDSFYPAQIRRSKSQTVAGFISRSAGGPASCPPYIIASVAGRRVVAGAALSLPEGYDQETLQRVRDTTGWVDQEVAIDGNQAQELSCIGGQILDLNEQGNIQPPLNYFEKQSITHLLNLVGQAAVNG